MRRYVADQSNAGTSSEYRVNAAVERTFIQPDPHRAYPLVNVKFPRELINERIEETLGVTLGNKTEILGLPFLLGIGNAASSVPRGLKHTAPNLSHSIPCPVPTDPPLGTVSVASQVGFGL